MACTPVALVFAGDVFSYYHSNIDGKPVCCKTVNAIESPAAWSIDAGSEDHRALVDRVRAAALAAAKLSHPCIERVYGSSCDGTPSFKCIVAERLDPQSFDWHAHGITIDAFRGMLVDALSALVYLHSRAEPVVHGGVCPASVFVSSARDGVTALKLGDVGVVAAAVHRDLSCLPPSVAFYAAPEGHGAAGDVFSVGVVMCDVAARHLQGVGRLPRPVPAQRTVDDRDALVADALRRVGGLSDDVADVLRACCDVDASKRPSARDAWLSARRAQLGTRSYRALLRQVVTCALTGASAGVAVGGVGAAPPPPLPRRRPQAAMPPMRVMPPSPASDAVTLDSMLLALEAVGAPYDVMLHVRSGATTTALTLDVAAGLVESSLHPNAPAIAHRMRMLVANSPAGPSLNSSLISLPKGVHSATPMVVTTGGPVGAIGTLTPAPSSGVGVGGGGSMVVSMASGGDHVWSPLPYKTPDGSTAPVRPQAVIELLPRFAPPPPALVARPLPKTDDPLAVYEALERVRARVVASRSLLLSRPRDIAPVLAIVTSYEADANVVMAAWRCVLELCVRGGNARSAEGFGNRECIAALFRSMALHPTSAGVACICIQVGMELAQQSAHFEENVRIIVEEGGIDAVICAMKQHPEVADIQLHGCWTLGHWAMSSRADDKIHSVVAAGGFVTIVAAMRRHIDSADVLKHVCMGLRNLSAENKELRRAMVAAGVVDALLNALRRQMAVVELLEHGFAVLNNVALVDAPVVAAGGAEVIVAGMRRHARVLGVQVHGAQALRNLSCRTETPLLIDIATAGGVEVLIAAMRRFPTDGNLQSYATIALWKLSADPAVKQMILAADARALIAAARARHPSHPRLSYDCDRALESLDQEASRGTATPAATVTTTTAAGAAAVTSAPTATSVTATAATTSTSAAAST